MSNKSLENNIIGERLKLYRNEKNISQLDFANILEIPQSSLSAYENGKKTPSLDLLVYIAKRCDISIDWLCGNDKNQMTLGDFASFMFNILEAKEFSCKSFIHDRVDIESDNELDFQNRNFVQLSFFHNQVRFNSDEIFSMEVALLLSNITRLAKDLENDDITKNYYDEMKKNIIERYRKYPITQKEFKNLTEEEVRDIKMKKIHDELL